MEKVPTNIKKLSKKLKIPNWWPSLPDSSNVRFDTPSPEQD